MKLKTPPADFFEKKPLYKPYKSKKPEKKGMVYVIKNDKKALIYFGDSSMEDFTQHYFSSGVWWGVFLQCSTLHIRRTAQVCVGTVRWLARTPVQI